MATKESESRMLIIIGRNGVKSLGAEDISLEIVGQKAFGLSELPLAWVPAFFVVDALTDPNFLDLMEAARRASFPVENVCLRSSGINEGIDSRGSLESVVTTLEEVPRELQRVKLKLMNRFSSETVAKIHWVVQAQVKTIAKGHLSNEIRLAKVPRDWVAEFEPVHGRHSASAPVAVRRWRDGAFSLDPIYCDLRAGIPRALRKVANWRGNVRAHFEWVWDGGRIWMVQVDPVPVINGVDPRSLVVQNRPSPLVNQKLGCFRVASTADLAKYRKLANARIYSSLGYDLPNFYLIDNDDLAPILDDARRLEGLRKDLGILCSSPLVLRTDAVGLPSEKCQMLPRSDELRDANDGIDWLKDRYRTFLNDLGVEDCQVALLGHHFVPAAASAWCLAFPNQRRVRIEAIWGIPEGLYYYPHDVFDIDTGHVDVAGISEKSCRVVGKKIRYKGKFIAPDNSGRWVIYTADSNVAWKPSISNERWANEIAVISRKVSKIASEPVVVMWFVDIPTAHSSHKVLPWYHEAWSTSQSDTFRNAPNRRVGSSGARVLRTAADLSQLLSDTSAGRTVTCVAIEPEEEEIVRRREFIESLAADACKHGYEVQLRGGVLSHVFYALARSGCIVSCVDLFKQEQEVVEYNKLVRDGIPSAILYKGEGVEIVRLVGEAMLSSLKTKLIEEAIEVLDAESSDAIADELADVLEVVESIATMLDIRLSDVRARKKRKAKTRGGFMDGLMLLRTHLGAEFMKNGDDDRNLRILRRSEELPQSPIVVNIDKRKGAGGDMERQVTFELGLVDRNVIARGNSIDLTTPEGHLHPMTIEMASSRDGGKVRVKIRIVNAPLQLSLLDKNT